MRKNKNKHRAFLKWAGGKYSLIEQIKAHLPEGNKLLEPFVGAGSVFLNTDYPKYVLNDINADLINLYTVLRDAPDTYINDAQAYFNAMNNAPEAYYALRKEFNQTVDIYHRSLLFLYLNRHGYNGLCRYNLSGEFNVPFGRYKAPYFPKAELYHFAEKAQRAVFTCENYKSTFARARANNVIYCDPPYAPISKTANFTQYAGNLFGLNDQRELAEHALSTAKKRGITVLVSNHDTPDTREFYHGAEISELQVTRSISQKGHTRKKVSELFALYRGHNAHSRF
ncbi:Dam family site-specific DNA-(adenine-N6)-methyltransferase [Aestuariibacter sp. AA17]|uniref:Site-specific DNA-methyltransferase (adenine-specific) n=1 Tax=Fluctibacter corallii TaxID=2984329 RepID=A0ABT3A7S8_9ALTE|nr:Dam family site-specific DNA-(adenine-N6)-methyltransferase [Aestuariibacter sp. AA17]MCV2884371.1 Dam family site-specific DNA-(adenine-N6)-methyltransferase [Aestuariibacter sp. AA17]